MMGTRRNGSDLPQNNTEQSLVKPKTEKPSKAEKIKQALRVRFALEQEPKVDMYFYKIYRRLRLIRYICVLLAALFVMSVPMAYSEHITTENFKYLMKYIDLQLSEDSETYTAFRYDSADGMQFGNYQDDIVICTDTALVFYDKLGNESLRVSYGPYDNPRLLVSDKYVMVYDRGGNEYAIYNGFKQLHRVTTDYPITLCALNDSGGYAVLTSNQNYTSELLIYNRSFKQTNRVQRDLYISDLFFTEDGTGFGYAGFTTKTDGSRLGQICTYNAESKKISDIVSDEIPLSVNVTGDVYRVLYADRLVCYAADGKQTWQHSFVDTPSGFTWDHEGVAVSFLTTDKTQKGYTQIIARDGSVLRTIVNQATPRKLQWNDGKLFIIDDTELRIVDENGKVKAISLKEALEIILFLPNGEWMGCYSDHCELISAESFK